MSDARAKLEAIGIRILEAEVRSHFILERDGFVAFVERRTDSSGNEAFGNIGAPAFVTEQGIGVLLWRGDQAYFVGKGFEQLATGEQVQRLRAFAADLEKEIAPR